MWGAQPRSPEDLPTHWQSERGAPTRVLRDALRNVQNNAGVDEPLEGDDQSRSILWARLLLLIIASAAAVALMGVLVGGSAASLWTEVGDWIEDTFTETDD